MGSSCVGGMLGSGVDSALGTQSNVFWNRGWGREGLLVYQREFVPK